MTEEVRLPRDLVSHRMGTTTATVERAEILLVQALDTLSHYVHLWRSVFGMRAPQALTNALADMKEAHVILSNLRREEG